MHGFALKAGRKHNALHRLVSQQNAGVTSGMPFSY